MVGSRPPTQDQRMRHRSRARQDLTTMLPVVGTSLMMALAASGGYDDADETASIEHREPALV
jgi:hypothetical protein